MPDEKKPAAPSTEADNTASEGGAPAGGSVQTTIQVRDEHMTAAYANFCRVSSTPEELILDLGLNPQPYATGQQTVDINQRIILNHYTAKRLLIALSTAVQRHEQAFGVLETDIRKRVKTQQ